jgi:hypothetical protein
MTLWRYTVFLGPMVIACAPLPAAQAPKFTDYVSDANQSRFLYMGRFVGMGTLETSACEPACAQNMQETLLVSGTGQSVVVTTGTARTKATSTQDTLDWQVYLQGGTCDGVGKQTGSLTFTADGATGVRMNSRTTRCNGTLQTCSCSYKMSYKAAGF